MGVASGRGKAKTQAIVAELPTGDFVIYSTPWIPQIQVPSPSSQVPDGTLESARFIYKLGARNNLTLIKVNIFSATFQAYLLTKSK